MDLGTTADAPGQSGAAIPCAAMTAAPKPDHVLPGRRAPPSWPRDHSRYRRRAPCCGAEGQRGERRHGFVHWSTRWRERWL